MAEIQAARSSPISTPTKSRPRGSQITSLSKFLEALHSQRGKRKTFHDNNEHHTIPKRLRSHARHSTTRTLVGADFAHPRSVNNSPSSGLPPPSPNERPVVQPRTAAGINNSPSPSKQATSAPATDEREHLPTEQPNPPSFSIEDLETKMKNMRASYDKLFFRLQ